MNNLPYRDQGKKVNGMPIWLDLEHPPQPHEYDILMKYLTGEERFEIVKSTATLISTNPDEYNKIHDKLFRRAIGRWNANYIYMNISLGNLWRYMDEHQLEQFYDGIQMLRNHPELRPGAKKYIQDLKQELIYKKKWMDISAKLLRDITSSNDDMVCMKLAGARHSDYGTIDYTIGEGGVSYVET